MKKLISTTALVIALASPGHALFNNNGPQGGNASASATAIAGANASATVRNTNTNVNTNVNHNAQGQLQGQIQGQSQSISGNNSSVNFRDRKQAPGHAAPSMSSGHPCAFSPASLGVSFIGGAVSGGGMKVDVACMLGQLGYTDAAMVMYASGNSQAASALEQTGYIQRSSGAAATTSSRSVAPEQANAFTSCKKDGEAIRVGVRRGASEALKSRAVADCKALLR